MATKKLTVPKGAERAGPIERADAALGKAAAEYRKTPVVKAIGKLGDLADQPPLFAVCAAAIAAGAVLRKPRLLRAGLRMLASEGAATGAKALAKHFIARTRPGTMLRDGRYALEKDKDGSKDAGPWNSFPSGHTAGAFAVGRALIREYPAAAPVVAAAVAVVALIQPFTGAHFPSDVAAGGAVGLASEAAVDGAMRLAGTG